MSLRQSAAWRRIGRLAKGFRSSTMRGRWLMIGMVVVPLLVFYAIWLFYPIGYGFYHSFFDWNPLMKHNEYLGIGNYRTALFEDHLFWNGLLKAGYYTVATVPTQMMIGLLLAIMIYSLSRFQALYRTVYYLPVVTSMVAVSFIWKWMYQPRFGLITYILGVIGGWMGVRIPELYWLGNVRLAMPAIAIMSIWKGLGNTIIIFLAGLSGIPRVYYEAARIDGANGWHLFRHVTWPLLEPTLVFLLVTGIIGSLQVFGQIYIMTEGGPVDATRTIVYLLYTVAFEELRFGYASAIAFLLCAIIISLTILQLRLTRATWVY